jgi:hypothetical protein
VSSCGSGILVNAASPVCITSDLRCDRLSSVAWRYRPWVEVDFAEVSHCLGPQFLKSIGELLSKVLVADQE